MVITGCNDNDNMMLVVELVVVFMVNIAMNKMRFRVDYMRAKGPSVGPFAALFWTNIGFGKWDFLNLIYAHYHF